MPGYNARSDHQYVKRFMGKFITLKWRLLLRKTSVQSTVQFISNFAECSALQYEHTFTSSCMATVHSVTLQLARCTSTHCSESACPATKHGVKASFYIPVQHLQDSVITLHLMLPLLHLLLHYDRANTYNTPRFVDRSTTLSVRPTGGL